MFIDCLTSETQSFAFVSILTSTILEFGALLAFNRSGLNVIPSGPLALVFSIIYQYYRLVPHAYSFKIFGVTLTDKAFTYFLGLQVRIFDHQHVIFHISRDRAEFMLVKREYPGFTWGRRRHHGVL